MAEPQRILVIDRDPAGRRLLAAALNQEGKYAVEESASGPEGLSRLGGERSYALAVVDPDCPTMKGWRMLSELRRLAPQMPVLVLSTVFNAKSVARAIELGAEDYLHKPVDLKELRRTVNILLELDDAGRPARRAKDDATGHLVVRAESEGTFMEITAPTGSPHIERFQGFVHRLLAASLPKDEYLNVRLALEESVTNAIEWGNRHDRTKNVKLSYCLMLDRVTLRIEDEGEGFTPEKIPDPSVDPVAHLKRRKNEGKRVGGWGLFLTKRAVDEVWYNKKGNVVFLTKFLRKPANAEAEAKLNA